MGAVVAWAQRQRTTAQRAAAGRQALGRQMHAPIVRLAAAHCRQRGADRRAQRGRGGGQAGTAVGGAGSAQSRRHAGRARAQSGWVGVAGMRACGTKREVTALLSRLSGRIPRRDSLALQGRGGPGLIVLARCWLRKEATHAKLIEKFFSLLLAQPRPACFLRVRRDHPETAQTTRSRTTNERAPGLACVCVVLEGGLLAVRRVPHARPACSASARLCSRAAAPFARWQWLSTCAYQSRPHQGRLQRVRVRGRGTRPPPPSSEHPTAVDVCCRCPLARAAA